MKKIRLFSKNVNGYWDGVFEFDEGKEFDVVDVKIEKGDSIIDSYKKALREVGDDDTHLLTHNVNSNGYITFVFGDIKDFKFKPIGDFH